MNPNEKLLSVSEKVEHLIQRYRQLQEHTASIEEKNEYLQSEIQRKTEILNGLEEKVSALKFGNAIEGDAEWKNDLKKRLGSYMKEIDKCIAQLEV